MNAAALEAPLLIVISAPSGAGKTTLCHRLLKEMPQVHYSVSCTTRPPRAGETDGESYHFMDTVAFERQVAAGAFLEHAVVFGHHYGTLKETVRAGLEQGRDVLMDIDVQGAAQIRDYVQGAPEGDLIKDAFVDIFIAPPSIDELRARLLHRGKDSEEVILRRVATARAELQRMDEYRYLVVNDDLEVSYDALRSIVVAEHHRLRVPREEAAYAR